MQDYNDPWWDEYLSTGEDPTGGEISGEEDGFGHWRNNIIYSFFEHE